MATNSNSSSGNGVGGVKNPNPASVFDALPKASALEGPKEPNPKNETVKQLLTIKTSL